MTRSGSAAWECDATIAVDGSWQKRMTLLPGRLALTRTVRVVG